MSTSSVQETAAPAIEVRGLRKSYGRVEAVRGIDLRVSRGEVFALLGPNGAGKTTTVEILEGHRSRTAGQVSVLGYDPGLNNRAFKRQIGIVLQSTGVEPYLSVEEAIELYRGYYPPPSAPGRNPGSYRTGRAAPYPHQASVRRPPAPAGRRHRPGRRPGTAVPG